MNSETQLKIQAYLDDELDAGEARKLASQISTDPLARGLYNELKNTREAVSQNEPVVRLEESRDFYWSKIRRGIEAAERDSKLAQAARPASSWWVKFLVPIAGTVALFAVFLSVVDQNNPRTALTLKDNPQSASRSMSEIEHAPDVSTITFRSEAEGVTVVWVSTK